MSLAIGLAISGLALELETSWLQSRWLAAEARRLTFRVEPGATTAVPLSPTGPHDRRLGYATLPASLIRLQRAGYEITAQAGSSDRLLQLAGLGLYPIYREKPHTGLRLLDRDGLDLLGPTYSERAYRSVDQIPTLVLNTLLFIEDRDLLEPRRPHRNPAVEWDRFALAVASLGLHRIFPAHPVVGGSTLATQLEKLRHSPGGLTSSVQDKLVQMVSASLRGYLDGDETLDARRRLLRDYINSMPLAASPDYGEVVGLGDGLWAWWGADVDRVNGLLAIDEAALTASRLAERALAYRQVLSLLLAINRPSTYLIRDREALASRTDRFLPLLAEANIISPDLRTMALSHRPEPRRRAPAPKVVRFAERKAPDAIRAKLVDLLGLHDLYQLDRLDLTASTTLNRDAGTRITRALERLRDAPYAAAAGLRGTQLLDDADPASLIYSFTLYERGTRANLLRIQSDNYDQPLNVSEGTKLELGSTAKLRTLVAYLDIVAALHDQLADQTPDQLATIRSGPMDRLTAWAVTSLLEADDTSLPALLETALTRRYSASPAEGFFTGGGVHHFQNFTSQDDALEMTVRDAFQRSVNLVFVRLMRDVVQYYMFRLPGWSPSVVEDRRDPQSMQYLARFADREGREFVRRFYREYRGRGPKEATESLLRRARSTPESVAATYRVVRPEDSISTFGAYLGDRLPERSLPPNTIARLYYRFSPGQVGLSERAHVSGVHPLELAVTAYLAQHPEADLTGLVEGTAVERQRSYDWLFTTSRKHAQDQRIRTELEIDAFAQIHRHWARLGYPFASLVPSYATALGSSGDNPSALAELVGIIVNEGIRYPTVRVTRLHFAEGTPYETVLHPSPQAGVRVLDGAVAAAVRKELIRVVEGGTARRASGAITLSTGASVQIGGKTGTGDNRIERYGPSGQLVDSRVLNRTATFVFLIGNRFYGTVTAYVPGAAADAYRFTSALPVQVFRHLVPTFRPLLERAERDRRACSPDD